MRQRGAASWHHNLEDRSPCQGWEKENSVESETTDAHIIAVIIGINSRF